MLERLRVLIAVALVTLLAGGATGYSYRLTQQAAQRAELSRATAEFATVLTGAASYERLALGDREVYEARDGAGQVLGLVFRTEAEGFGGPIKLLVSVDPKSGRLGRVRVSEQTETPGIGAQIMEPGFLAQFEAKPVADAFEAGADVQAISGATISSTAVAAGIKAGLREVLAAYERKGGAR